MANPEHVAILEKGIESWNRWRAENPSIKPDLSEVDFKRREFVFHNFSNTNLSGSRLSGALLVDADLSEASLINANLGWETWWRQMVNLDTGRHSAARREVIDGANFTRANLSGANFEGARVYGALFNDTNLQGADFYRADVVEALFINCDLTGAHLTQARYAGRSTVDLQTIRKSGTLPITFLRGCGLPQSLIDYLPSLLQSPIQFFSCFMSYSNKNQEFADRLHADLQDRGVRCWFAPEDLKIGDPFRQRIDESIRVHDKLLLILSGQSVQSAWVQDEVEAALERERRENRLVLFPIRIDDSVMNTDRAWASSIRRTRHIGDFSRWKDHDSYQKAFKRLLRDLEAEDSINGR